MQVSAEPEARSDPCPGRRGDRRVPTTDVEILNLVLLLGGGFDTTTALTAHALEWLWENPAERPLRS